MRIQAGLHLCVDPLLVAYPSSFLEGNNETCTSTQARVCVGRLKHDAPELETGCDDHGTELLRAAGTIAFIGCV